MALPGLFEKIVSFYDSYPFMYTLSSSACTDIDFNFNEHVDYIPLITDTAFTVN